MSSIHVAQTFSDWLSTPQGQYLLQWEQSRFDAMVADIFGYNAVQIGLPAQPFLRSNRISYRLSTAEQGEAQLLCDPFALPLATTSVDLVLLPHVLEYSRHPHQVLREVERVLVPEGSVIIAGFNPFSLFGLRRALARRGASVPWQGHYFSAPRIRDWLTLLGFDTQSGGLGCYAPPMSSNKWIERWGFMDRVGSRWWPFCGGVYMLQGIKRVHGMRLITPKWRDNHASKKALSPVARRTRNLPGNSHKTD
ncbi:class I SAM-dependent methyltransferase [Rhodocyclaceae bacterium SMB388]